MKQSGTGKVRRAGSTYLDSPTNSHNERPGNGSYTLVRLSVPVSSSTSTFNHYLSSIKLTCLDFRDG